MPSFLALSLALSLSPSLSLSLSLPRSRSLTRQLYLLDDPLSAVDAQVGRALFENCIRGALQGKTVIFVTHQLQFLSSCDRVLFMGSRTVVEDGSYDALIANNAGFARLMEAHRVREKVTTDAQAVRPLLGSCSLFLSLSLSLSLSWDVIGCGVACP
jgi:ABC-type multidrug transport system ATPase subunit